MTDYMKEAERLIAAHESAIRQHDRGAEWDEGPAKTLSALLAHIQRGAVPDGWQVVPKEPTPEMLAGGWGYWLNVTEQGKQRDTAAKEYAAMLAAAPAPDHFRDAAKMVTVHCTPTEHEGRIVYEHTSEPIPNADGFVLYAASADQFRTAAKMMAVQPACMTCSGHGMVGGLLPNGGGYEADPRHDCTAPAPADDTVVLQPYGVRAKTFDPAFVESLTSPAPAEVPMPEDDMSDALGELAGVDTHDVNLRDNPESYEILGRLLHTYGDARDAAGYARGLKEARERIRRGREILDAALRGEVKP